MNQELKLFTKKIITYVKHQNQQWKKKLLVFGVIFLVVLSLDILTKQLALHHLQMGVEHKFLPGFLALSLTINYGIAFGAQEGSLGLVIFIQVLIILITGTLLILLQNRWLVAGFTFIFAGGVGNLLDRMWNHGGVVDFIVWKLIPPETIFNCADVSVIVGCVVIGLSLVVEFTKEIISKRREYKAELSAGEDNGTNSSKD